MKHWKKSIVSGVLVAAVVASGLAVNALADSREEQEMEALKTAFVGAEETVLDMSEISSPKAESTGTTAGMSEEELNACIADYTARVEQYFSDSHPAKQHYIEQHEAVIRNSSQEVYYLVDGGVLSCELSNIQISDDGNTATFQADWSCWNNWAEQAEDGTYQVTAPINNCSATITMVKEGGLWKLLKTEDHYVSDANEAIDAISDEEVYADAGITADEAASVTEAYDETQDICQTSYSTFQEALAAAKSIDVNAMNPYPLLEQTTE